MKGVIFTEFMEHIEAGYGLVVADRVLTNACPFHRIFTSVGYYDYHDLVAMVTVLSKETGRDPDSIIHGFGKHIFQYFLQSYPGSFTGVTCTMDLLKNVEHVIHTEVRKLHPDAELPRFEFPDMENGVFQVEYFSSRPFATLAQGLIQASLEHFQEPLRIVRCDLEGVPGTHTLFQLSPCSL